MTLSAAVTPRDARTIQPGHCNRRTHRPFMSKDTHTTAPTRYVEAGGIRYAYRHFGADTGIPLLFLQHFRGGMDNWDPLLTDGFARDRPVILFNNAGIIRRPALPLPERRQPCRSRKFLLSTIRQPHGIF